MTGKLGRTESCVPGETAAKRTERSNETKFSNIARDMQSLVREEKSEGNTVAIDMTPGRKFMSAFSMYMGVGLGLDHKADKIYYLHVKELGQYSGLPFPMIPSNLMTLYDLKKEVTGK